MDKEVRTILGKYIRKGVNIDDLQSELISAGCVIYKSELPPITGQAIQHVDATPDKTYPIRILQVYRQNCDCRWAESIDMGEPINPLLQLMNEDCDKRAELLNKAIKVLQDEITKEELK